MRLCRLVLLSFVLSGLAGCGGCDETGTSQNGAPQDAADVLVDGRSGADGSDDISEDGQVSADIADGATGDSADGTSENQCPRYHDRCGGECIQTHVDPDNCGSCGNVCTGDEACSAGQCTDSCLPGRTKCGNRCVNVEVDSEHCGECGRSCPTGEGCVNGECTDRVDLNDAPDKCDGGGPPIDIRGRTGDQTKQCVGDVVSRTFTWGVCSCDSIKVGNNFFADAFDSNLGPYQRGGYGGSVGTNGFFKSDDSTEVFGNLVAASSSANRRGTASGNKFHVAQKLRSGGRVQVDGGPSFVDRDAFVEGDVSSENLTFRQTLHLRSSAELSNGVSYDKLVRSSVNVREPCTRCRPANQIPVVDIVERRISDNDNAAIGLQPDALSGEDIDSKRLDLPCGEYYLSEIRAGNNVAVVAQGRTALFIDGDVTVDDNFFIQAAPDAQLDVFVSGRIKLGNNATVGSPAYPAAMRMYVGGQQASKVDDDVLIGANLYAIPGGVEVGNNLEIFGALYTQKIGVDDDFTSHFDRHVLDADDRCPGGGDGSDGGTDAGADGGAGGGTGDQCRTRGDGCNDDGECCSPLICDEGVCSTVDCAPLYESCTSDGDCCSGVCATGSGDSVCVGQ